MIYFIQHGKRGPIKIGTTKDPYRRLCTLQIHAFDVLHIIGLRRGGQQEEARIHRLFQAFRLCGEWFKPIPEIIALMMPPPKGMETVARRVSQYPFRMFRCLCCGKRYARRAKNARAIMSFCSQECSYSPRKKWKYRPPATLATARAIERATGGKVRL